MKTLRFGSLVIGDIPRVVGTLSTLQSVRDFPVLINEKPCDVAEIRLDEIGTDGDWLSACRAIDAGGTPILFTLRSCTEGGKWAGDEDRTATIVETALPCVSAVDIEFKSTAFTKLCHLAKNHSKPVVASYHNFIKTPRYEDLANIVTEASAVASVVKISTMINDPKDVETLQRLLPGNWDLPLCVIGMGPKGTHTRTSFPSLGSCLTYGYLDVPSAPGQLSAYALVTHLRSVHSRYNEDFINRHKLLEFA